MFGPNHVDFVVADVPGLAEHGLLVVGRHPRGHVEHDLDERGGVVG